MLCLGQWLRPGCLRFGWEQEEVERKWGEMKGRRRVRREDGIEGYIEGEVCNSTSSAYNNIYKIYLHMYACIIEVWNITIYFQFMTEHASYRSMMHFIHQVSALSYLKWNHMTMTSYNKLIIIHRYLFVRVNCLIGQVGVSSNIAQNHSSGP